MSELELEQRTNIKFLAPAHTALSVREFLAPKHITVLAHPASSLVLAPSDFLLYPKLKEILKGRHFDDIDDSHSTKPVPKLFCRVD
jgi:hypothetical protein